jgi:hypothetical protein
MTRLDPLSGDAPNLQSLAEVPSLTIISQAALLLMSATAERIGLADDDPAASPARDLDEARRLLTALAGLVSASTEYLGPHATPLRQGLTSLRMAFQEALPIPDEPGKGPGDALLGPLRP